MRKLALLIRGNLAYHIPVQNVINILTDHGMSCFIIADVIPFELRTKYELRGHKCLCVSDARLLKYTINIRYINWVSFFIFVLKYMKLLSTSLWYIGSADTAICLYLLIRNRKYIVHVRELYDKNVFYRCCLKGIMNRASSSIVSNNYRAHIYHVWYRLNNLPDVMFNLPHSGSNLAMTHSEDIKDRVMQFAQGRKIISYVGILRDERPIHLYLDAVKNITDEYCFVIAGRDVGYSYMHDINRRHTNGEILYLGHVQSPNHLDVCKISHIGIIVYDTSSLNTVFCAPNKVWEYAMFSKPILVNEIPGLEYYIYRYGCGLIMKDINDFESCVRNIDNEYNHYSKNASSMYESAGQDNSLLRIITRVCEL